MADLRRCNVCGVSLAPAEVDGLCPRCLMRLAMADNTAAVAAGARLGQYEIVSMIGRGGMGEVYRARDGRLGRDVALKLLPPDLSIDENRMHRFEQEARAASSLNHPNILTIHEIGDAGGTSFIVTELVDGETLRERMIGEPMSARVVVDIAGQLASALAAAHDTGIIHRDIKPENVMVRRDGVVKVLDFGLAKSMNGEVAVNRSAQIVAGTPPYMSPEQALGRDLDRRSDLFSVGVMLYEMLTGTRDHVLQTPMPPIGDFNRDAPLALERIVRKCLEKDRERRYASARELLADLNDVKRELDEGVSVRRGAFTGSRATVATWTLVALVAAGVAATAYVRGGFNRIASTPPGDRIASVAVLPFRSLGPAPVEEYLQIGMADALITRLSGVKTLALRPTSAVSSYANDRRDPIAVGRRLRTDHVLDGTIQRARDRVRVTTQLVDVSTGRTEWAETFDESFTDLFALQDAISTRVAGKLVSALSAEERRALARRDTANPEAYDLYLRGRFFWEKRTEAGLRTAIGYFEQAVERDEWFALAYAGLAQCYGTLSRLGMEAPRSILPALRSAALKALELDDRLAETQIAMSAFHSHDWNWPGQEAAYKRAIELNPNYPTTYLWYGFWLESLGRQQENLTMRRRAYELDPLNLQINVALAVALFKAGHEDDAVRQIRRTLDLDSEFWDAHHQLGLFHLERGRYADAIAEFEKSGRLAPLGHAYAVAGDRDRARELLRRLEEESARHYVSPLDFAVIYAGLGENDRAFEWLERAFSERVVYVRFLDVDAQYARLRRDPRYPDLLRRIRAAYLRPR